MCEDQRAIWAQTWPLILTPQPLQSETDSISPAWATRVSLGFATELWCYCL